MNYIGRSLFLLLFSALLFTSCKEEVETLIPDMGYNYFPDDSGSYIIYKVDSSVYDDFTETKRTSSIFLKEVLTEQYPDNLGRPARTIACYYAPAIDGPWLKDPNNQYYQVKTNKVAERWENNLRYVKLVFPNNVSDNWLGNKYIISPPPYIIDTSNYRVQDWKYTITSKDQPFNNGVFAFDSTLQVMHIADSSVINKTLSFETYARNIGLVYREFWVVTSQSNFDQPWPIRAEKGFIVRQYAVGYGKEE